MKDTICSVGDEVSTGKHNRLIGKAEGQTQSIETPYKDVVAKPTQSIESKDRHSENADALITTCFDCHTANRLKGPDDQSQRFRQQVSQMHNSASSEEEEEDHMTNI